jgi:uncharacterized protein (DUF3084 family)
MKLETTISCLQQDLAQEKGVKEDSELKIGKLSQELEKAQQELKSLTTQFRDNQISTDTYNKESIIKLNEQNENLTAENFEYAVENVSNLILSFWSPLLAREGEWGDNLSVWIAQRQSMDDRETRRRTEGRQFMDSKETTQGKQEHILYTYG